MSSFEDGQRRVFFNDSILIADTPSDQAKADSSIYEAHMLGEKAKRNKSSQSRSVFAKKDTKVAGKS